jgi:uncharacterized membrane protein YkoI
MPETTKGERMRVPTKALVAVAALAVAAGGTAAVAASGSSTPASRLDDGKALLPQAKVTEAQAIAAAQKAASGDLDEVDLEHADGRLVWNVDVGASDVRVDASTGQVVSAIADD